MRCLKAFCEGGPFAMITNNAGVLGEHVCKQHLTDLLLDTEFTTVYKPMAIRVLEGGTYAELGGVIDLVRKTRPKFEGRFSGPC